MSAGSKLKILYLVHDVSDPAVARRVRMLLDGGAIVEIAGFRRVGAAVAHVHGCPVSDLGQSQDARLVARAMLVLKRLLSWPKRLSREADFDLVLARNLEMLLLAQRMRRGRAASPPIVYECLDIHRLMLGAGPVSRLLRALERRLLKRAVTLATSSPAFLHAYFETIQHLDIPHLLIENKALVARDEAQAARAHRRAPVRPMRIGWFGMIRCRKSFDFLAALAARGVVEVIIAGRPTPAVFPDFESLLRGRTHLTFIGPYQAADLARLYAEIDFCWAIDFYEEGQNSSWLLPNRLYESLACGAIPMALADTETGRYLASRQLGLVASDLAGVEAALTAMTPADAAALATAIRDTAPEEFIQTGDENVALVRALSSFCNPSSLRASKPK